MELFVNLEGTEVAAGSSPELGRVKIGSFYLKRLQWLTLSHGLGRTQTQHELILEDVKVRGRHADSWSSLGFLFYHGVEDGFRLSTRQCDGGLI